MFMKTLIAIALLSTPLLGGCQQQNNTPTDAKKSASHQPNINHQAQNIFTGKLEETFDAGGYTYVKIQFNNQPVWAAGPVTTVKPGDKISFSGRMPMTNFHSKSLNRDFPVIYFVSGFTVNGEEQQKAMPDPHSDTHKNTQTTALKDFKAVKNGQTISEILSHKDKLAGQNIRVRGQVSKFTADVMGKNWLHIRDHSSQQDLTITTDDTAALGDIIIVEGQLLKDKDFGYGYVYEVIIDKAKLTKQD